MDGWIDTLDKKISTSKSVIQTRGKETLGKEMEIFLALKTFLFFLCRHYPSAARLTTVCAH
jgi:hypothetical protein